MQTRTELYRHLEAAKREHQAALDADYEARLALAGPTGLLSQQRPPADVLDRLIGAQNALHAARAAYERAVTGR